MGASCRCPNLFAQAGYNRDLPEPCRAVYLALREGRRVDFASGRFSRERAPGGGSCGLSRSASARSRTCATCASTSTRPRRTPSLSGERAGKSNLIEALAIIFRNLDLDVEAPFDYDLRYECRGDVISVQAKADQYPVFQIRRSGKDQFSDFRASYSWRTTKKDVEHRPAFVFGYYSGPSDRLGAFFEKHRERFYSWIIKSPAQRGKAVLDPNALRRLFYAQTLHGQFALIAFFMEASAASKEDRDFLREHLQIEGLDSVLFALKEPPWKRKGGDPRFWNAVGEVRNSSVVSMTGPFLPLDDEAHPCGSD